MLSPATLSNPSLSSQSHLNFPCRIIDLGLIAYQNAYQIQKDHVNGVLEGKSSCLIVCEHDPVFTLGRLAREDHILFAQDSIEKRGISIVRIDRGGEVTFHGPGQLVIYPIFRLDNWGRDLKVYLEKLEQVAIDLLKHFGIVANSISGKRGVWVEAKKIVSMGVGVRRWVSYHGMAVNVNTDLNFFQMIRPCGMDVQMTSICDIKGQPVDMGEFKVKVFDVFAKHFQLEYTRLLRMIEVKMPDLGEGIKKAIVSFWFFKVGDKVQKDEDIVEVTTDKATFNVAATTSGQLNKILVARGQEVTVGDPLAILQEASS